MKCKWGIRDGRGWLSGMSQLPPPSRLNAQRKAAMSNNTTGLVPVQVPVARVLIKLALQHGRPDPSKPIELLDTAQAVLNGGAK